MSVINEKGKDHVFFKSKSLEVTRLPDAVQGEGDELGKIWIKCPKCKELSYIKEHEKTLKVCAKCSHHYRLRAHERVKYLLDAGSWVELNGHLKTADPLGFAAEGEVYPQKVAQTCRKTGVNESLLTGYGTIMEQPVAVAVADFSFLGASMGSVFGEKLARLIDYCIENRLPLITVNASGGARMHEGMFSLMQMAKTTAALAQLGKAKLPHISILTDPCYGGVTASYAMVADFTIAEPGAMVGFAGQRVIEQTTRQKLPAGFQTAEFLLEHGMLDHVVARKDQPELLSRLLKIYARANSSQSGAFNLGNFQSSIVNRQLVREVRFAS
jgi:acetyl-CoA carboxylase carboxyl transferase subunit beta